MTTVRAVEAPAAALDLDAARALLRPHGELEVRIRSYIGETLGRVLPPAPARGVDWYYDSVVLGGRALDAFRVLGRYLGATHGAPVLDVGCGMGSFVLLANAVGVPAVGLELDPVALALARERAGHGDVFVRASATELPVGSAAVAGVLLHDVLEHTGDWRAILAECRRVLRPGGVLYVKGPSYSSRFVEPHYRVPWAPMLPRPIARRYLHALGRDVGYFEDVYYRRRGPVLRELSALGFSLSFPRRDKVHDPSMINRRWPRTVVSALARSPVIGPVLERAAEHPLQATIDVVARAPGG